MLKASVKKHTLKFNQPGGTSRGILKKKDSWYLSVWDESNERKTGIGECGIIPKLSIDDRPDFEDKLQEVISELNKSKYRMNEGLRDFPAIKFGLETAILDLQAKKDKILYPSDFTSGKAGIPINGLIWMGSFDFMRNQIRDKINLGFRCIKLKIGAINFEDELRLLSMIKTEFKSDVLELRVDANGAFSVEEALEKLNRLSEFDIHSIEQPIKKDQWDQMATLCQNSPIPIALDEELIGVTDQEQFRKMIGIVQPDFIILKPGLLGGFKHCEMLIREAERKGIGWWVTSALEANIGLNAIAQWTYTLHNKMPQGLGTGQLFTNNIPSPLEIREAKLYYNPGKKWNLNYFDHD